MSREDGDEALMLRYRNGDVRAFELLYERHKGPLFRYFLRQCPQRAVAEELFQEVWTSVVRSRERYRVRAKFTTLLYRMAHNRLIDYRRSAASNPGHDGAADVYEDRPDGSAAADERLDADRRAAALRRAIASLPPEQREAFLLREEGGLRLEQIAQVTGVGSETAKSRLRYAVTKLREALSKA